MPMTARLLTNVIRSAHEGAQATAGAPPDPTLPHGYLATGAVLLLPGLTHCGIQEEHLRREQRRERATEQHHLTENPAPEADHPNWRPFIDRCRRPATPRTARRTRNGSSRHAHP